jgi:hypothetical protein
MGLTEAAANTVAELETKLAGATARAADLQTERRKLSFDANTGDDVACRRLNKLNAQSATIDLEIENIRSAIDEGRRRLFEANAPRRRPCTWKRPKQPRSSPIASLNADVTSMRPSMPLAQS